MKSTVVNTMKLRATKWALPMLVALLALAPVLGFAQVSFPTIKGNNQRTGNNGNPAGDNPGAGALQWFSPNPASLQGYQEIRTVASTESFPNGTWLQPIFAQQPTNGAWYSSYIYDGASTLVGPNRPTPYWYSFAVPSEPLVSGQPYDPRIPLIGYNASYWDFQITPVGNVARNYALFASMPIGPTYDVGSNLFYYPPQYCVFEIDYGTNQTYLDVVDRAQGGSGFVRLGNGGAPTDIQFYYDGVNPLHIKLFNTIPRDGTGYLSGVALQPGGLDAVSTLPIRPYPVYANAVQATVDYGNITASPIVATVGALGNVVYSAANRNVLTNQNGTNFTQQQGNLTAYQFDSGNPIWNFTPADQGEIGVSVAPPSSAVGTTPLWLTGNLTTFPPFNTFAGAEFYYTPTTNNIANYEQVTYAPSLATGTYQIRMFLPGNPATPTFAQAVRVEIDEGAVQTFVNVDLTSQQGYLTIGGRRFANVVDLATGQSNLVVKISNYSALGTDVGKMAFANAVRFVGAENVAINSTPVFANVNIGVVTAGVYSVTPKSVVVTASEDGRLYCLDAAGNGDGTTNVYWVYPSLPDTTNPAWADPNNSISGAPPIGYPYANQRDGSNGTTLAEMPTGFDLSSALVQEVPVGSGNYFLYIMSNNGRAYCIDMAGRGDYNLGSKLPGTTTRIWTYPNDYQPNSPTTPAQPTALGAGNASIVYNANTAGPTVFVPAAQGRMYALDAQGAVASATTTPRWVYPALTSPTLGALNSTPALGGAPATLYFGTEMKNGEDPGVFYSLDANTGVVNWKFAGTPLLAAASFEGGPALALNNLVGDGNDYIFVANQNGYLYALNPAGGLLWQTNELNVGAQSPLTYTMMTVFDNTGTGTATPTPVPIVIVPSNDGGMYGYFATQASLNRVGGRLAWGYVADGDHMYAGMATADDWMYDGDNYGYLYAFHAGAPGGVGGIGGPGATVLVPNDPAAKAFANAKVAFYLGSSYQALEQTATPDYGVFTNATNFLVRTPPAFDFGEVLYVMVYDFPYDPATSVNFSMTVGGNTQRQIPVQDQPFSGATAGVNDGYAVLTYPIQPIGANAMVPGSGNVGFSFNVAAPAGRPPGRYVVEGNPKTQQLPFILANPLGIALQLDPTFSALVPPIDFGLANDSVGADAASFANPSNWQNLFNGAPSNVANTFIPANLLLSAGAVGDGATGEATMFAYDRSLMSTLNGPDLPGIPNVRVDRGNMAWQGGYAAVKYPFGGLNGLYGGLVPALNTWEDYPTDYPNISLDYSDLVRQSISVTSNRTGAPGNPVFYQIGLGIPNGLFDANGQPLPVKAWAARTPNPTEMNIDISVPAHQPANASTAVDTLGVTQPAGYLNRVNLFTDSVGNGQLDGTRDSYRTTMLSLGIPVREHMTVLTPPTLDLGSLEEGLGIEPSNDVNWGNARSPWPWAETAWPVSNSIYKSFQAVNDGNVNLWNVRLARQYNSVLNPANYFDWPMYAGENDDLAWLDATKYMYSNLDQPFSASMLSGVLTRGENIVQKPRPGSTAGTEVLTNPTTLLNGNLGNLSGIPLIPDVADYPLGVSPYIAITPPIGMPVGQYQQNVDLIEDGNYDMSVLLGNATLPNAPYETYADPTLMLSFNVREAQLSNQWTLNSFPQADNFVLNSPIVDANSQPAGMRDNQYGDLIFAWSSNRPDVNNPIEAAATNYAYRLYFAGLAGSNPSGAAGVSPLDDLAHFGPQNATQWFSKTGPYPLGATSANGPAMNALFNLSAGDRMIGTNPGEVDTVRFGDPAFPSTGIVNPFDPSDATKDFAHALMAFIGSGQVQTATGRASTSLMFVAPVVPVQNASPTVGAPIACLNDPDVPKGRPGVLQVGTDQAVIFYAAGGTGRSRLFYTLYNNGTFTKTIPIDTGMGFDSVGDPSATIRPYQGVDGNFSAANPNVIDLAFSGRLRGRPNNEIFLGRIIADANGAPVSLAGNSDILYEFEQQILEPLHADGAAGSYRTTGAVWDTSTPAAINAIDVQVAQGNNVPATIVTGRVFDPNSGTLTLTTTFGTVYVDTLQGTVKFASSVPGSTYAVYATYQPRFFRVSQGATTAMSGPQLLWDARYVGTRNYDPGTLAMYDRFWYFGSVHANLNNPGLINSRYWMFYNRAGEASDQSSRPMMGTLRLGVQLPWPIPTNANGDVDFTRFQVNGAVGPYQVDPAKGKVYFTPVDEDCAITFVGPTTVTENAVLTPELAETPVPIENPASDGSIAAFIDPFDPFAPASRRPDMVWLLWSSTRGGTSDVYFETVAPLLWPVLK